MLVEATYGCRHNALDLTDVGAFIAISQLLVKSERSRRDRMIALLVLSVKPMHFEELLRNITEIPSSRALAAEVLSSYIVVDTSRTQVHYSHFNQR